MSAFETETATKRPIDEHVQNTLIFIQKHENLLHTLDNGTRKSDIISSESHTKPIRLTTESYERVLPQDLIYTDNEHIRKSITVLVFLCDEIHQLKEIAETRFYRPLLIFGTNPPDKIDFNKSKKPLKHEELLFDQPGMKEKMIGKFLPLLQELSNYIDRCYSVCLNIIQQLSSLMNNNDILYRCLYHNVYFINIFKYISELLTILITLDSIIQNNENLLNSWNSYKSMITIIRQNPSDFNTNIDNIIIFERLIISIDQSIMINEIFKGCIEQNFEILIDDNNNTSNINIRNNLNFMEKQFLYCIKEIIVNNINKINTNNEIHEKEIMIGCIGLYALYRQLLPSNQYPDPKLYKIVWGIQKTIPLVIICETVMWNVGKFIFILYYCIL